MTHPCMMGMMLAAIKKSSGDTPGGSRYWRLRALQTSWAISASYLEAIYELRMFESTDCSGVNVAQGCVATASQSYSTFVAGNAFDGSNDTYWQSSGAGDAYGAWIMASLSNAKLVRSVSLRTTGAGYHAKSYALESASSSDGPFTTVATLNTTSSDVEQQFYSL